jgi:DNA processing protein
MTLSSNAEIAASSAGAAAHLTDDQRLDWLRLIRSDNVGPRTFRALVKHYGGARAALSALPDLARRGGATRPVRVPSRQDAERELAAARSLGVALVALGEPDYPQRLAMIDDAPPLLAIRGNAAALTLPIVAIVGARNASAAGIRFAERLARDLGAAGFAIVSGLARGIDGAAHRASLATGTIAALAGGHDQIYPPEHAPLAQAILAQGALISEMPMGWEPRARDFPRRNRLISGLAAGVVIVEAARRSGSLITARMALEQGREVFAVPGSPLDPRAEGTNDLIKQGAALVTQADDVVTVLRPILGHPIELAAQELAAQELAAQEFAAQEFAAQEFAAQEPEPVAPLNAEPGESERERIAGLLGPTPVSVDDLVRLSGCTPAVVRVALLELELAGRLEPHGGALVSLAWNQTGA